MKQKTFRPDLSEYLPVIEALRDKLNEKSIYKMSLTDAVKLSLESSMSRVIPSVVINSKRKKYLTLEF